MHKQRLPKDQRQAAGKQRAVHLCSPREQCAEGRGENSIWALSKLRVSDSLFIQLNLKLTLRK